MINEPDTNTPGKVTTVTGSGMSYNGSSITITGGGGGAGYQNTTTPDPAIQNGISGGSGGGNSAGQITAGITTNANYNFANDGGTSTYYSGGSGGGAGQHGVNSPGIPVNGANGIQCLLPGIATFTPSGYFIIRELLLGRCRWDWLWRACRKWRKRWWRSGWRFNCCRSWGYFWNLSRK